MNIIVLMKALYSEYARCGHTEGLGLLTPRDGVQNGAGTGMMHEGSLEDGHPALHILIQQVQFLTLSAVNIEAI